MTQVPRPPRTHPTDAPPPEAPHRPGWIPRRDLGEDGAAGGQGGIDGRGEAGVHGGANGNGTAAGGRPQGSFPGTRPAWALPAALTAWVLVYPAAFRFRLLP
ncbi:MAG TPA: hypothetical protein VG637_08720, partial [Actinomycetes bacterium]|nr:hypothetical protein [Actinomycetes bacterium]